MNLSEKRNYLLLALAAVIISGLVGGLAGFTAANALSKSDSFLKKFEDIARGTSGPALYRATDSASIVNVVDASSPAVVSVIVSKDLSKADRRIPAPDFFRQFMGDDLFGESEEPSGPQEVGSGSGFIVSKDGLIVTNKHVVADEAAEYTVVTNQDKRYPAKVLARDPSNDLAILKIEGGDFPVLKLGSSVGLKPGQEVVAIGNALGEFSNTVSTGVISGLSRSITAYEGPGFDSERLIGLIQTDASINTGNSGGPLLDTAGNVIGINVAVARNAQNIGFAIPIDQVKATIENVQKNGRLVRAWLGVRYVIVNPEIAKQLKLAKDYGALVIKGDDNEPAVIKDSPAERAGLKEDDIILEAEGKNITEESPLSLIISQAKPGDMVSLNVWRDGKEKTISAKLEELKQ